jgi:hypothetical protein
MWKFYPIGGSLLSGSRTESFIFISGVAETYFWPFKKFGIPKIDNLTIKQQR